MSSTGSIADSSVSETGETFRALRRAIVRSRGLSILLCVCDSPAHCDELIDSLAASTPALKIVRIDLESDSEDLLEEVSRVLEGGATGTVMVTGLWRAFARPEQRDRVLDTLNLRRGEWPSRVPCPVVFWIPREHLGPLLRGAPDFFDWRSDTLEFPARINDSDFRRIAKREWSYGVDPRLSAADQHERVLELRSRLAQSEGTNSEVIERSRLGWWDELAELLEIRGEIGEALRIRTEEELPVYERLGDVREKAVTQGKIADILQDRGQLDEALRIRTEEQLPVFERLGDVREKAVTQGKIADILQARGQLDEALRIRTEEQLPVFERLGDVRELLVARTNIALLLLQRGEDADRRQILVLLYGSLREAHRLRLPEAGQIAQLLESIGLPADAIPEALARFHIDPDDPLKEAPPPGLGASGAGE